MQIERTHQTGQIFRRWMQCGLILALSLQCATGSRQYSTDQRSRLKKCPPTYDPPAMDSDSSSDPLVSPPADRPLKCPFICYNCNERREKEDFPKKYQWSLKEGPKIQTVHKKCIYCFSGRQYKSMASESQHIKSDDDKTAIQEDSPETLAFIKAREQREADSEMLREKQRFLREDQRKRNKTWEEERRKREEAREKRENERRRTSKFLTGQLYQMQTEKSRSGGSSRRGSYSFTGRLLEFQEFMDDMTEKNITLLHDTYETFIDGKDPNLSVSNFYHCVEAILIHYDDGESSSLTDEQTQSLFAAIFKARMLTWEIFREDPDDNSIGHFERIICAYKAYKHGTNTGIPYMEYMNVFSDTSCDDMVFAELTKDLHANDFATFKSLMDNVTKGTDPEVEQILKEYGFQPPITQK